MTLRVMFDSMIFDLAVADEAVLERLSSEESQVAVISTHVQDDELAEAPDAVRGHRVPLNRVPTMGFVIGFSRIALSRLSDSCAYEAIVGSARATRHAHDSLIAATAKKDADVLVTNDDRLARRSREIGIAVWSWDAFREWLLGAAEARQASASAQGD